jgi:V/A-type H+-transporting ATPase subunit I
MRIDVKKFLFLGNEDKKEAFFKQAQELGLIHFINTGELPSKEIPIAVQHLLSAIKILRGLPSVEQEENYASLDVDAIVEKILFLQEQKELIEEESRVLNLEMSRIEGFGNFSLEDIDYIEKEGKRIIQFFCSKLNLFKDHPAPDELVYLGTDHSLDYYVAINPARVSYDKMIEIKIDRPLGVLAKRYQEAQREYHQIEQQLKGYAKYNEFLHESLISKLNYYHLYQTEMYVQYAMDGKLFAIEGWVPENKVKDVQELVDNMNVYSEEVAIEPQDAIPTYLENEGFHRLGEDLVHIYDTPSSSDKDPSLWVLFSFTLFFAFIIGDAGYGLIYLALALFLRYKYPNLKGTAKRVLDLFTVLSAGCIVWGVLMTSFFGIQIAPDNPLRKVSLLQRLVEKRANYAISHGDSSYQEWIEKYPELSGFQTAQQFLSYIPPNEHSPVILARYTDNIMFELALFIGVVHLIISFLRYTPRHWQNLGWVIFLIGAYLYFPYYLQVPSLLNFVGGVDLERGGILGFELMIGGILFAWVGSIIIHGLTGIFEIMTVIQVFADTLSYLRLYALGLAGAIVAATINEMAANLPVIMSVLLVLISHAVNIILGTMSGIIHGLRLNFLEWYHYSFEGGGKLFQPLKLLKRD